MDVETGQPRKKSDISFFRETQKKFDNQQIFSRDKAYIGEQAIKTHKKKPKKGDLTELEKSQNKDKEL